MQHASSSPLYPTPKSFCVPQIGESKADFGVWQLDKDLKTYHGTVVLEGRIDTQDANDLKYHLRSMVQAQQDSKLALIASSVKDTPAQLNINLA
jgi:hypothetical protein